MTRRALTLCPQEYAGMQMRVTPCIRCGNWDKAARRCDVYIGIEHLSVVDASDVPFCPLADRCQHQRQAGTAPCAVRARGYLCESVVGDAHPLAFNANDFTNPEEAPTMIETGVVITRTYEACFWHRPPGRSAGYLPDSRTLWDVLWTTYQAENLLGFAHSHPGTGAPAPSQEDLSTFIAIEAALGRPLLWWITSTDRVIEIRKSTMDSIPGREIYGWQLLDEATARARFAWLDQLRTESRAL